MSFTTLEVLGDGPKTTRRTVLVVDDKRPARRLMNLILRHRYRILEAHDPGSALALLDAERVDLVLLDLHLPPTLDTPQEGLWVYSRIRERSPVTPVVVVTGNDDVRVREVLLAGGVRGFLAKPFDAAELVKLVRRLLEA